MNFSIIVAIDKNNGIGKDGQLPWSCSEDLKHFKRVTLDSFVIMGRKTWESIPNKVKPLPRRINIVLSKTIDYHCACGVKVLSSLESALGYCKRSNEENGQDKNIFIMGGGQLYKEALDHPDCRKIYQSRINGDYNCDTFFKFGSEWKNVYSKKVNDKLTIEEYYKGSSHLEYNYLNLIKKILKNGEPKPDRTGTGTLSLFGEKMEFSLENNTLPILTTKRVPFKMVLDELIWFISGNTNAKTLQDKKIHIWDGNSSREYLDSIGLPERKEGDLGPVYGFQWRFFSAEYVDCHTDYKGKGVDQLQWVIDEIKSNPSSRRIFMSSWNPKDLKLMALPPCHLSIQFNVGFSNNEPTFLDSCLYQRSADVGLGVPFNITSYSILTIMIARLTGLKPRKFVHVMGDTHIYKDHIPQLETQVLKIPFEFPTLRVSDRVIKDIDDFKSEDFKLVGYKSSKRLKMKMSV